MKLSQLCRTRIIERDKIIPRKSLQPNNWQKNFLLHPPTEALGCPSPGLGVEHKKDPSPENNSRQEVVPKGAPKAKGRWPWKKERPRLFFEVCTFTKCWVKNTFADTQAFRGDFKELIYINVVKSLLQREDSWRNKSEGFVCGRRTGVG